MHTSCQFLMPSAQGGQGREERKLSSIPSLCQIHTMPCSAAETWFQKGLYWGDFSLWRINSCTFFLQSVKKCLGISPHLSFFSIKVRLFWVFPHVFWTSFYYILSELRGTRTAHSPTTTLRLPGFTPPRENLKKPYQTTTTTKPGVMWVHASSSTV